MENLVRTVKSVMRRYSTHPRRRLGQNFMVSEAALNSVCKHINFPHQTILEIGPGLGFLTRQLASKAETVIAVELDKYFCEYLAEIFPDSNVKVKQADILKFQLQDLSPFAPVACIGNIPYQITSPLLERLLEHRALWSGVLLTIQKDVAKRLGAEPGGRDWSALSCWIQLHARVHMLRDFGPNEFYPAPKVDSSLIQLEFFPEPRYRPELKLTLQQCIRGAFQKRRKQIVNALTQLPVVGDKANLERCLIQSQIKPSARPETLTLDDWIRLAEVLQKNML